MIKLLRAGFFRLKKELIFWIFIFATIVVSGIRILTTAHYEPLDKFLYDYIIYIGLFIAMFVSVFVGKEHAEGIVRNKIIVGHNRISIYISKLIISIVVSVLCEFIYIAIMFLIGSQIYEPLQMSISQLSIIILNAILIIITYCSIFNLISMICSEATISVVTNVAIFVIMFVAEIIIGETASQSKYITISSWDNDVRTIVSQELNPNYPGDDIVNLAKTIYLLLPQGQAHLIINPKLTDSDEIKEQLYTIEEIEEIIKKLYKMPIYSIIVISVINIGGLYLFSKKELK